MRKNIIRNFITPRNIERFIFITIGIVIGILFSNRSCTPIDDIDEVPISQDTDTIVTDTVIPIKKTTELPQKKIKLRFFGSFNQVFRDLNEKHLTAARSIGVSPIYNVAGVKKMGKKLTPINSCKFYTIDELKFSVPYLVPKAARLLQDIGRNFSDTLALRGASGYKIIVTSVLRVDESVVKLRKRNSNASDNSAHRYGTTFDISYTRYDDNNSLCIVRPEELKHVLGEVLFDLKKKNRCYVKHEVKQGCFHITAR